MPPKPRVTVAENLYWIYANLAMAHAAIGMDAAKYSVVHFQIRAKLYKGLREGTMSIGSLLDDERLKMELPRCCAYCGSSDKLTLDHLIARSNGGPESGDNALWVCRPCNSSKGAKDFATWWFSTRESFPPLLVLRRYLKLAIGHAEANGLLDRALDGLAAEEFPLDLQPLRRKFPGPGELELVKGSA